MKNLIRSAFAVMAALSNSACSENAFCNAFAASESPPYVVAMSSTSSRGRDGCIPKETKRKPTKGLEEQPIYTRDGVPIQCKVVLVVQNHAESGLRIPTLSLTDAFTAELASNGFQVINPYNAIGRDLNRTPKGEVMPEESAVGIAKRLEADGVVTASIDSLEESKTRTPTATEYVTYRVRVIFNLADAWSSATIASGSRTSDSRQYRLEMQIDAKQRQHLEELLFSAGEECARNLLKNNNVREWMQTHSPTPPPPPMYPYEPLVLSDVENALNVLRGKMLEDGKFNDRYNELFAQRSGSPVLMVGGIKDLTKGKTPCAKLGEYVDLANDRLQTTLDNTHRFTIKDFAAVEELRPYIEKTDKDPLSDRSLLEALQRHLQPDLFVAGHIKYISEAGLGMYYIHLGAYDFLKGVVVWQDDVKVVKTLPKGGVR